MKTITYDDTLYQLVPKEPTEEMHIAAIKVLHRADGIDGLPKRMLDAMLSAAPTPPAQPAERNHLNEDKSDLYWRLHILSKALESSGRIDEHDMPDAYATILDSMAAACPAQPAERKPLELPAHKCSLSLTHNEHHDYYISLEQHIADMELADCFQSPEDMQRAIDTDECWVLHWYPDTPIGFYRVAAPTLEEVLQSAHGIKGES